MGLKILIDLNHLEAGLNSLYDDISVYLVAPVKE